MIADSLGRSLTIISYIPTIILEVNDILQARDKKVGGGRFPAR